MRRGRATERSVRLSVRHAAGLLVPSEASAGSHSVDSATSVGAAIIPNVVVSYGSDAVSVIQRMMISDAGTRVECVHMHLNAGETPPARLLLKGKGEAAGTSGVYLESQLAKARSSSVANGS